MTRLIVGPFNRVEGDLEVQLDMAEGRVASARVVSPMYRGFEPMLVGRPASDALVIVPRICGICSVSQSVAAARALASASGVSPPPNGLLVTNLMLACENAADHLTHFYLFFMPDFTREVYAGQPWFALAQQRFAVQGGEHSRQAVAARQRWFTLMGTLGGKWPHTQSVLPGGSSRAIEPVEALRLLAKVREFRAFLETTLLGDTLETITGLRTEADLKTWADQAPLHGDLRLFLHIAALTGLHSLGPGPGRLMSSGAYALPGGGHHWPGGVWHSTPQGVASGPVQPLDLAAITEDATHAWLAHDSAAVRHPRQGLTRPEIDKPGAYTWNKAPRLAGQVAECGAVARQVIAGQPLVCDLVGRWGTTVTTRVLARLIELARLVPLMETWLTRLQPREPYHLAHPLPDGAEGCGLTEAARGMLGHWLRTERGHISHYQIIAPTSWNFSPRDAQGTPGPLESALVDAPVQPGETTPVAVQHIVRSFDPCMVCTVH
jgi:hydrogenase large subunit